MDETDQVLDVLDRLVGSTQATVSVPVSSGARAGLARIRGVLEHQDIDGLLAGEKHDPLAAPPAGLREEDLKYFNAYRESYTAAAVAAPSTPRSPGKGFHGCVRQGAGCCLHL